MFRCARPWATAALLTCVLIASPAAGQRLGEIATLPSGDGNLLGPVAALDGGTAAVGAPFDDVWVYSQDPATGTFGAPVGVRSDDFATGDAFGLALDLRDGLLAVGVQNAALGPESVGAVYLFEQDGTGTWGQTVKLLASNALLQQGFGRAVALGAVPGATVLAVGSENGLYVLERSDTTGAWAEVAVLGLPPINAVSVSGGRIAALSSIFGEVFVVERDGAGAWTQEASVTGLLFPGLDLDGDRLAVRARDDNAGTMTVRIHERDAAGSWPLAAVLTGPADQNSSFGNAIDLDGDRLLVGSARDDLAAFDSGAAYLYGRGVDGSWSRLATLLGSDVGADAHFGRSAAMEGNLAVVGVDLHRAYVFDLLQSQLEVQLDAPTCTQTDTATLVATALGTRDVDLLAYRLGDGPEVPLCLDCGDDPSLPFDVDLAACANTVTARAVDVTGTEATAAAVVRFDTEAPVFSCAERVYEVSHLATGLDSAYVSFPVANDGCDGPLETFCGPIPNTYPVGRTSITCSATDACGQSSSCTYDLVVVNAPPPPEGCRLDDFRDEVGGTPVGGFRGADLGDGRLFSPWMTEDGLEVLGLGSQLYHGPDNGGFFYLTLTDGDDLRVEVPLPEQFDFSNGTYQKGGVMLRFGLDPLAPRVMVTHVPGHPNGPSIQFDVRRAQGQTATELASTQPVADVDRLAIETVGDEVWVEVSSDGGATWRRPLGALGGRTTLVASGPPLVGMAVASYDPINDVGFLFPEMLTCVSVDEPPPPVESAIMGQIWWDQDADGQVDDGEPALGGVAVELVDLTASVVATRITDSDGQYRFDDPEGELYGVRVGSAVDLGGPTEPTRFPDSLIAPDSYLVSVPADTVVTLDVGYRVVSGGGLGACQLDDFSDGVLDPEWSLTRFGDATVSDAAEAEGVLALSGDGSSMYVGPDHGAYLFRDADGDFRLEATVDGAGMTDGGPYEKAGLMVRPGLGGDEPRLILQLVPYWNNGPTSVLQFRFRAAEGGPGDGAWASNIFGVPKQARLAIERRGDTFIAEYSLDGGATWQRPAGGAQGSVTLDWPDVVMAGLDIVSYASTPSTARFDDVELCPVSP